MANNQEDSVKKKVLLAARRLFFGFGYSKVTMDELASELNMSKRTLYQFYESKKILLEAVIYDFFQEFQEEINKITYSKKEDALVSLKQIISLIQAHITKFSIHAFEDIKRNNPKAWETIINLREKMFNNEIRKLLIQAKEEKTVRDDIDIEIIVILILNTIQAVINPETISRFPYTTEEVIDMLSKFVISGIKKPKNNIL
ncbi:MAG: TetR/AcrR family transcriptional regulator [Atribacterota bacterium]|jgi:AcrR family transcriptional regulator|nr:TetR/AcrR family transcriptional regulator [Atribacterota bacterium]MDD3641684.1 TetR/AcrR family transcriptional regulator [Atribacterota bacterium]MDD4765080.1 TetR/AcrR family transcriptional regulator [Atribacterota bacterium]MDI9596596.1 TetR/AcrR family transcriptional regulator [Atribacterota bacterium]